MTNATTKTSAFSVQDLCMTGLFTAVIVVMAQISIPMPLGVPMTMQTFAISLAAIVLGAKRGAVSAFIYLLLGAVGLPVFAGFTGGFARLAGPTGGFLFSFPVMAFLIGLGSQYYNRSKALFLLFLVLGNAANYIMGTAFFCALTKSPLAAGLSACVIPFIPTTILKAILAWILGIAIKKRLPDVFQTSR